MRQSLRPIIIVFFMNASPLFAKSGDIATDLVIDWTSAVASSATSAEVSKWTAACKAFAKKLTRGAGPNGVGPFTTASCVNPGKSAATGWTLTLDRAEAEKMWRLRLKSGSKHDVTTLDLDAAVPIYDILSSPRLTDMIALYLAEAMPFRTVVSLNKLKREGVIRSSKDSVSVGCAKVPKQLVLYTLEQDGNLWSAQLLAKSIKASTRKDGKGLSYKFDEGTISALKVEQGVVFAHDAENPKRNLDSLRECLARDIGKLNQKWYALAQSAYVGVRYGVPLIKTSLISSQAPLMGVFGEFRSGIFDGLKLHYDWAPKQTKADDSGEAEYEFSRLSAGLSFDTPLDLGIFNYVDLTPKLGVTNLKLSLTPGLSSEEVGYEMRQQRAPTIGLEVGAERRHSFGLYRLWSYFSYSLGVIPIDKNYSTTAVRTGLDSFFKIVSVGSFNVGALLFGVFDYTSITSNQPEGDSLKRLMLTHGYLGGGLTVNW